MHNAHAHGGRTHRLGALIDTGEPNLAAVGEGILRMMCERDLVHLTTEEHNYYRANGGGVETGPSPSAAADSSILGTSA